ncbi:MAG: tetratricopeptide repeat protein [Deltaproteobacteria bacterium]|nr:tetratricopeptide repeat protein [Deltaproteobacteria bacterium]
MTAKKVDTKKADERLHSVEEALSMTEKFIEKNQKIILIVVGVLIIIVLGFFGFRKYYLEPKEKEAQGQMFMAEMYFEQDSLSKALNGDGQYPGFLEIIDQYSLTKSANLASYYAGISYLKLGDFEQAIEYLNDFDGDDQVAAPMATGAIGDAYMELDQVDKAIGYYLDAADQSDNELTAPLFLMKAGMVYEIKGNYRRALDMYQRIKKDYPRSFEGTQIDKYISFAKKKAENN